MICGQLEPLNPTFKTLILSDPIKSYPMALNRF